MSEMETTSIRNGLWTMFHHRKLGQAWLLFGYFLSKADSEGSLRTTYAKIHQDIGAPIRTLQRWVQRLKDECYINIERSSCLIIWVLKFNKTQISSPSSLHKPPLLAGSNSVETATSGEISNPIKPETATFGGLGSYGNRQMWRDGVSPELTNRHMWREPGGDFVDKPPYVAGSHSPIYIKSTKTNIIFSNYKSSSGCFEIPPPDYFCIVAERLHFNIRSIPLVHSRQKAILVARELLGVVELRSLLGAFVLFLRSDDPWLVKNNTPRNFPVFKSQLSKYLEPAKENLATVRCIRQFCITTQKIELEKASISQTYCESLRPCWEKSMDVLKDVIDAENFNNWFEPVYPVSLSDGVLNVVVPNHFFQRCLELNYRDELLKAISFGFGESLKLDINLGRGGIVE